MVQHIFEIDNIDYCIYLNRIRGKEYYCLCCALLQDISHEQLKSITVKTRKNENVILFVDLVDCFQGLEDNEMEDMEDMEIDGFSGECICGKTGLTHEYYIKNVEKKNILIVGSTCCNNWYKEEKIDGCQYCHRNKKLGGDCNNCAAKRFLQSVIKKWKEYTKKATEKIDFGKYSGLVTYKNIARKSVYANYLNYILSDECKTSESRKNKILQFCESSIV